MKPSHEAIRETICETAVKHCVKQPKEAFPETLTS